MAKDKEVTLEDVNVRLTAVQAQLRFAPWIASALIILIGWYVETSTDQTEYLRDLLTDHDKEARAERDKLEEKIDKLEEQMRKSWMDQLREHWDRTREDN